MSIPQSLATILRDHVLHGMNARIPRTHRYQVADFGSRLARFFTRVHARRFRPALSEIMPHSPPLDSKLRQAFECVQDDGRCAQSVRFTLSPRSEH